MVRREKDKDKFRQTWDTGFKGSDSSPFPSTLLSGRVEDLIDHGFTVIILELENVGGYFDQERVKNTAIPAGEDFRNLIVGEIQSTPEDFIGLSNQLHVTVFNPWAILSTGIIAITESSSYRCGPS